MKYKKIITLSLISATILTLAACKDKEDNDFDKLKDTDEKNTDKSKGNGGKEEEKELINSDNVIESNDEFYKEIVPTQNEVEKFETVINIREEHLKVEESEKEKAINPKEVLKEDISMLPIQKDDVYKGVIYNNNKTQEVYYKVPIDEAYAVQYISFLIEHTVPYHLLPYKGYKVIDDKLTLVYDESIEKVNKPEYADKYINDILNTIFENVPGINKVIFEYKDENDKNIELDYIQTNKEYTREDLIK